MMGKFHYCWDRGGEFYLGIAHCKSIVNGLLCKFGGAITTLEPVALRLGWGTDMNIKMCRHRKTQ